MRKIERLILGGRTVRGFLLATGLAAVAGCVDIEDGDGDGYALQAGDCNDEDPRVHPGAVEIPGDGIDENCNGNDDEDTDGDGYSLDGAVGARKDCDDSNPNIFPGNPESIDGVDQDCDGIIDNLTKTYDDDGDGFAEADGDCNDRDSSIYPGATERLNGLDDNCDGIVDEGGPDVDDDGDGLSENEGDCDDTNPAVYPGASETGLVSGVAGDGIDNDCDGIIDEGTISYDNDGDGFSANGTIGLAPDCDDANPKVYPGAQEDFTDLIDSDCDGFVEHSPADGPQPPGFTDIIPSTLPAPLLEYFSSIDNEQCNNLDFVTNLQPLNDRVYSIHFFDIRNKDGSGGTTNLDSFVDILVGYANAYFAGTGASFVVERPLGIESLQDSQVEMNVISSANPPDKATGYPLYQAVCKASCSGSCDANNCVPKDGRISVLIVDKINAEIGSAAGVATFPAYNNRAIVLSRNAGNVLNGDAFPHELGHYFGLYHTFCGSQKEKQHGCEPEAVKRDYPSCSTTGDLLCDTPADPGASNPETKTKDPGCSAKSCKLSCDMQMPDQEGDLFQPDIRNVMSYYPPYYNCNKGTYFTPQQIKRMICAMRYSPHLADLTRTKYPCVAACCDGSAPAIGRQFDDLSCGKESQAACSSHKGLASYTFQSEPPVTVNKVCAPSADCYVRCNDDNILLVGQFQSSFDCVNAGSTMCPAPSYPIRIAYGGYYAWCEGGTGCWIRCKGENWDTLPGANLSKCNKNEGEIVCGDGNVASMTYCAYFGPSDDP